MFAPSARATHRPRRALAALACAAALGCCVAAVEGCGATSGAGSTVARTPTRFAGAALSAPVPAPPFTLSDTTGRRVSLVGYRGRVTIVAFLDSTCRACVLIAQQIRGALGELTKPPPVLFVSADPAIDTPAHVSAFLHQTGLTDRALYLAGPRPALGAVLRSYRVLTPARGKGLFEAALTVYLLDRQGRERVVYQQEQLTPEALAGDVRALAGG